MSETIAVFLRMTVHKLANIIVFLHKYMLTYHEASFLYNHT